MNPLLHQFLAEGRDFLEQTSQKLLQLEETPGDEAVIGEIFRLVHTLKGNSGLFDMPSLTSVVHAAEDILDRVRDHSLEMDSLLTDTLLSAMDFIMGLLDEVESDGSYSDASASQAAGFVRALRQRLPERETSAIGESTDETETLADPADWSWLARLDETERAAAFDARPPTALLTGIRYQPEPECFFKGEDPVQLVRNIPGLVAFAVTTVDDWPEPSMLDIYRSNLVFDMVSNAARDEIEDHVRYVREQVALYPLPSFALALPQGEDEPAGGSMVGSAFADNAATCLKTGDIAGLQAAAEAALDMMNPGLRAASGLRWLYRLIEAGAGSAVLAELCARLSDGANPDWHAFSSVANAQMIPSGAQAAASAPGPASGLSAAFGSPEMETWRDIAATQKTILACQMPVGERAGRIRAVRNTLASLLDRPGLEERRIALDAAVRQSMEGGDCGSIVAFIDSAMLSGMHLDIVAPPLEPDLEMLEQTAVKAGVPELAGADIAPVAGLREAATGFDPGDGGRRGEGPSADRGVRVLKVPQEKVDRLMDLIGEMVVAKNALPYLATRAEDHFGSRDLGREIKAQYSIINRIAEEMQDGIMQVRMLPVGAVFQRFPRLVRDVARQLGKVVKLIVEGEETEADKNIVEALSDPLIHILRNSLDHGLETPENRRAAGKPDEGRLTVRASQEGDRVLIEIEDDGKGIDPAIIRRKAFEKGLIDEQRLETLTDAEAVQLVFAAGFSTADQISNLSGRGVGMDVVKSSLEKVGGQVQLSSEKGKGTRIVLSLPLSMSVSNVMMVYIAGQQFGVPMDTVVETVRVPAADIHWFKDQRTAVLRGRIVPLYGANELLKSDAAPQPNSEDEYAVLVVRVAGQTVGVIVDGFAQTIDVILKPLEGPLAHLSGFGGSALLGDGSVLLVLNLKELI